MTSGYYPRTMEESVVTVGNRATLPSIFMENEFERNSSGQSNLRYRNQKAASSGRGGGSGGYYDASSKDDSVNSTFVSVRSTPYYGTPGTTRSFSDYDSPDSGFHGGHNRTYDPIAKSKGVPREDNPNGSYVSPDLTEMARASVPLTSSPFEQAKIKSSLRELQSRWRHQQRRAALHGVKESFKDVWGWISDLDTTKEIMPIIVTSIIIASCVVAFMLLSSGLRHNLEVSKIPDGSNMKYKSIEYGAAKLKERLENDNRVIKDNLRDESGTLLGGKKAAIQFAHNVRNKNVDPKQNTIEFEDPVLDEIIENSTPPPPEESISKGDEVLEELSVKVAAKVATMISRSGDPDTDRLLEKLSKFGHSTPAKVDVGAASKEVKSDGLAKEGPASEAKESENLKPTTEELKKVKRSKPQTPNEAPFKIHKELPMTSKPMKKVEDDPFRGKSNSPTESESKILKVKLDSGSSSGGNPEFKPVIEDKIDVQQPVTVKCKHKPPTQKPK